MPVSSLSCAANGVTIGFRLGEEPGRRVVCYVVMRLPIDLSPPFDRCFRKIRVDKPVLA